ncbi:MAG: hypothetical protein K5912_03970 [Alphaproteobacteria bacterium]|nr:hypothetical protein [Alphaproteobacteria bacterium]
MPKKWTKGQISRNFYQLVKEQLCLKIDSNDMDDDFLSGCDITKRKMKKLIKNTEKTFDIKITEQEEQELSSVADIMFITIEKISERGDLIGAGLNPQPWRHAACRPNIFYRPKQAPLTNPNDERHLTYNSRQFDNVEDSSTIDVSTIKSINVYSKFRYKPR